MRECHRLVQSPVLFSVRMLLQITDSFLVHYTLEVSGYTL